MTKKLKFKDNSIVAFFSSHVLEHLYHYQVKNLLKEIFRCLKIDGYVRTALPDLELIMKHFDKNNPEKFLTKLFENENSHNYKNFHKWMYSKESFKNELLNAGFKEENIKIFEYQKTVLHYFINLDNRPHISLFVEAKK